MKNVREARSHSGLNTYTDHRLVITTINIQVSQKFSSVKKSPPIDFSRLRNPEIQRMYSARVEDEMKKS